MGMFPHWFGLQKYAKPQNDTRCPNKNCRRRFELAMSPEECPFCGCKLTPRVADENRPNYDKMNEKETL